MFILPRQNKLKQYLQDYDITHSYHKVRKIKNFVPYFATKLNLHVFISEKCLVHGVNDKFVAVSPLKKE